MELVSAMIKHSIIIPTAGRPVAVRVAIESVLLQGLNNYFAELIVVDNNSNDDLAADIFEYCKQFEGQLRYVRELSPGLGAARHRGAKEAIGEWLTYLDDDVEVSSGWIEALQRAFNRPHVGIIGGPSVPKFTCSVPEWFWDCIDKTLYGGWMCPWWSLLDIGRSVENIDPDYIWGLNFSIRKKLLFKLGGFHPDVVPKKYQRWQGDGETGLTAKARECGIRADYVQDALVFHTCGRDRLTPAYLKQRAFYQGVCNSFMQIRAGKDPVAPFKQPLTRYILHRTRILVSELLTKIGLKTNRSPQFAFINSLIYCERLAGWSFHQFEVANDPDLLAWVRRPEFFDADLTNLYNQYNCGVGDSAPRF